MARSAAVRSLAHGGLRYHEVVDRLTKDIASGELAAGKQLLGERELCKRLGVSRVTLRRALHELREDGLIVSDQARGWFVARRAVGEPNVLMSFSEMAHERGLIPSSIILHAGVRPGTFEESEELRIAPGSEIFEIERVRQLDGLSVALERSRVPLRIAPFLPRCDLRKGSLYAEMAAAGAVPAFAQYTLQAVAATKEQAQLLGVKDGVPLLKANAITYDRNNRPIELSRSIFLGDRYMFRTTLYRTRGEDPHR